VYQPQSCSGSRRGRGGARRALQEHKSFTDLIAGKLPDNWEKVLPTPTPEDKGKATRLHSQDNLNALCAVLDGARGTAPGPAAAPRSPHWRGR